MPEETRELLRSARRALRAGRLPERPPRRSTRGGSSASMSSPTRATTASSCCCPGTTSRGPTPRSTATRSDAPGFVAGLDRRELERAGITDRGQGRDRRPALARRRRTRAPPSRSRSEIASEAEWQGLVPHRGRKVLEIRPERADQQGDRRGGADPGRGRGSTPLSTAATTAPTWTPSRRFARSREDGGLERGRLHRRRLR